MTLLLRRTLLLVSILFVSALAHAQSPVGDWTGTLPPGFMMMMTPPNSAGVFHFASGGTGTLSMPNQMMGGTTPPPPAVRSFTYTQSGNTVNISLGMTGTISGTQMTITMTNPMMGGSGGPIVLTNALCTPEAAFIGDWNWTSPQSSYNTTTHLGFGGMGTAYGQPLTYILSGNWITIYMVPVVFGQPTATGGLNGNTISNGRYRGLTPYGATRVAGTGAAPCPVQPPVTGNWTVNLPGGVAATINLAPGGTGTLKSPNQGGLALPLTYSTSAQSVTIDIPILASQASFTGMLAGSQMSGTWLQNGQDVPLVLTHQ